MNKMVIILLTALFLLKNGNAFAEDMSVKCGEDSSLLKLSLSCDEIEKRKVNVHNLMYCYLPIPNDRNIYCKNYNLDQFMLVEEDGGIWSIQPINIESFQLSIGLRITPRCHGFVETGFFCIDGHHNMTLIPQIAQDGEIKYKLVLHGSFL